MDITLLGAGREVGRSGILVKEGSSVLLDYGIKIEPPPPQFPILAAPEHVIISHAHLDHCGALPILVKSRKPNIYMTDVTRELADLLIKDSMKVARKEGYPMMFGAAEAKKATKHIRIPSFNDRLSLGSLEGRLFPAGHIPGSAGVLLQGRKSLFYTGDVQTTPSKLLDPCKIPDSADILVIESTYGRRVHADRGEEEKRLIEQVEETLANDGTALLPVFAVGRSQEVLMMLEKFKDSIAIDGMVKAASEIIAAYGSHVRDAGRLRRLLEDVTFIENDKARDIAVRRHQIIVSSAGMLGGGPAVRYLREIKDDANSKVLFTGFLIDGTPGKRLLDTGIFENREERFEVRCAIDRLNLSAHADKDGLYEIIKSVNPELVICVHGDDCAGFASDISAQTGITAKAPANGELVSWND